MLKFLMLMVAQFGKTKGFSKFITKYGQKAFDKIQNKLGPNTKFSTNSSAIIKIAKESAARNIKKTVPKTKPVKHKTELQRVKEQIIRDKLKPKVKEVKGKNIIGYVRQNFGKAKPYGLTKSQKEGIAYLNATRGPGHTLKDLKRVMAQTKKRLAMKKKPKKP